MKEIELDQRKKLQLDILKYVDSYCKEHGLTYFLAFGTLIGAIRHKGYIPWDDDIDIMMPRKDYEELMTLFPKNGIYRFLTLESTKNYPYAYGKVIDTRTVKIEPVRDKYKVIGLDIDVFPIDNYPNNLREAETWSDKILKKQKRLEKQLTLFSKKTNLFFRISKNIIVVYRRILDETKICSVNGIVRKINNLSQEYNNQETDYCGIAAISTYGVRKRNRKEVFSKQIDVEFEGNRFPAPVGYDEYLRDVYGDYMQLPPENKRKTHHSSIEFWK